MLEALGKTSIARGLAVPISPLSKYIEWQLLRETLVRLKINCVLDVGANCGQFAGNLRKIGYEGHIVSFEPVPEEFATLTRNFQHDARWQGFNIALGEEDAERTLNVAVKSTAMSSFLNPVDPNWNLTSIQVTMKTLDSIFDSILQSLPPFPNIFLKMDTQGYDVQVVRGAVNSLPRLLGLQSELSVIPTYHDMPTYLQALGFYQQLGFRLAGISPATNSPDGVVGELNCVMIRA